MLTAVKKKSRLRRWITSAFIILVVLVSLIPLVFYLLTRSAAARWDQLAAQVRASGEPLTYEEILAARSCPPDDADAAALIYTALAKLNGMELPDDSGVFMLDSNCSTDFFKGISAECVDTTRAYVAVVRDSLDVLARLSDCEASCLDISYSGSQYDIMSRQLKFASSYRALGKIAHSESVLKIIDSDIPAAVDANLRQLRLAEPLYQEPMLILNLVALATDGLAVQSAEGLLRSHELSVDDLTRMQREWERQARERTMRSALLGERASLIRLTDPDQLTADFVVAQQSGGLNEPDQQMSHGWIPFATEWWLCENRVQGVQTLGELLANTGQLTDLLTAAREVASRDYSMGCFAFLTRTLMPSITRAVEVHARGIAQFRCVPVALAAERFRTANGRFPAEPDELVPEFIEALPADPFDGKPLRLASTKYGIVIYSVGSNMTDEGGNIVPAAGEQVGTDYGFRLLHPSERGVKLLPSDR